VKKTVLLIGIIFFISKSVGQNFVPTNVSLRKTNLDSSGIINELASNVISEIKLQGDSTVWLGTGQGLAMMQDSISVFAMDSLTIEESDTIMLLTDGISAIAVNDSSIIVAGATDDGVTPVGAGFYFAEDALDPTISWIHFSQPIDNQTDTLADFADKYFRALPITVANNNVTYDAAISDDYIWITSWAGGLRRIPLQNLAGDSSWTRVPLPLDDMDVLTTCSDTSYADNILKDYYLNPRDPLDDGNHNHKAFSVLAYGDTVWVGTANGINRGLLGQNGCIDWVHFSFPQDGISGNFVVGLARQVWENTDIIWAVTMNAEDQGEERGLSYTIDNSTWHTALIGERIYNVYAEDSLVFAASENGLWKSIIDDPHDTPMWALFEPAIQAILLEDSLVFDTDEILTNEVISFAFDNRPYYSQAVLWLGTLDGLARSSDIEGRNWQIFRAEYDPNKIYAYPNPYSPYSHNLLDGDGYVRFHTSEVVSYTIEMSIYNFALGIVFNKKYDRRSGTESLKWDGKDQNGKLVDNGVYFINLKFAEKQNRSPEDHWLKLIVVK
jgi:ligand-binding sensor domain-containing protein